MNTKIILATTLILALSSCHCKKTATNPQSTPNTTMQENDPMGEHYSPNTLIIAYEGEAGKESLKNAIKKYGATIISQYDEVNFIAIQLPEGANLYEAKAHFEKVKGVTGVQFNNIYHVDKPGMRPGPAPRIPKLPR